MLMKRILIIQLWLFVVLVKTIGQNSTLTLPTDLYGEWYKQDGGNLELGLYEKAAIYKAQVWHYNSIKTKARKNLIELVNTLGNKITLNIKTHKSNMSLHASSGNHAKLTSDRSKCHIVHDLPIFTAPVLRTDTIYYSGYMEDYEGDSYIDISTDNLMTGEKIYYHEKIAADGTFNIKIPNTNPVVLDVANAFAPDYTYIEPGKKLLAIFTKKRGIKYTGNAAPLVEEMNIFTKKSEYLLDPINYLDKLAGKTPEQYKSFFQKYKKKEEAFLDSIYRAKSISPKTFQIQKLNIHYAIASYLLRYTNIIQNANSRNNMLYIPSKLGRTYYDFLQNLDDNLAPIAPSYFAFILDVSGTSGAGMLIPAPPKRDYEIPIRSIDTINDVMKKIHNRAAYLDTHEIQLLDSFDLFKNNELKKSAFINQNREAFNTIIEKCAPLTVFQVIIPYVTNYFCGTFNWRPGVSTDLMYPANGAREIMNQNITLPPEYFDLKYGFFHNSFIANYTKGYNPDLKRKIAIQNEQEGKNSWNHIDKNGILSIDTTERDGLTLIFINKYKRFPHGIQEKMVEVFFKVYPEEKKLYNIKAPNQVTFLVDPNFNGLAATADSLTRFNPHWFEQNPKDFDVVTHEVMHIVQAYKLSHYQPSWVTEGIADYVRLTLGLYNKEGGWSVPDYNPSQNYNNSYRITARFFYWLEKHKKQGIVKILDVAMRNNQYTDSFWENQTAETIDDLWKDYGLSPSIK